MACDSLDYNIQVATFVSKGNGTDKDLKVSSTFHTGKADHTICVY